MKTFLILMSCCLIFACAKDEPRREWETIDFGSFTLEAPSAWKEFTAQGFDSRVGGVTNGRDTLKYDYGMYSYRFTNETAQTHVITEKIRGGYPTKMVKPKKRGQGLTGIYFDLGNSLRLTLFGKSNNERLFVQILESVVIK
jgi:hypothetical protein